MKKTTFVKIAAVLCCSVSVMVSCMKKDMKPMDMNKTLNIDYPAAYVVNGEDASISVVKTETREVAATISLMGTGSDMVMWPHHVSLHANHLALGVPGMDLSAGHNLSGEGMGGKLLVVDATNGSIVKNLGLSAMNHNSIYSPDGTEIWVPQMKMDGKVLVYDATTNALKNTIAVGMMPAELTFSSDGTKAYVANGDDNTVSVINVSNKTVVSTIKVGENPVGAWTGSNGKMYVDNEDGQSISVIDVQGDSVEQTISLGFMPGMASLNSKRNELWVSDPMAGKVHFYNWDASMKMWMHGNSFTTGNGAHAIAFTKDGNFAYVTNQIANTVSVVDVNSHTALKSIAVGKKPNGIVLRD